MKYYVISDIHGDIDGFNALIDKFNPEKEKLIFIGDLCSRGLYSFEILSKVKEIVEAGYGICLKGNHEFMFLEFIKNPEIAREYISDYTGGSPTILSFCNQLVHKGYDLTKITNLKEITDLIRKEFMPLLKFIDNLPRYYETKNYLFVHAGINSDATKVEELDENVCIWGNGLKSYNNPHSFNKTIVFGHMPTQNIQNSNGSVFYSKSNKLLGIDGGGFLNDASASINSVILSDNKNTKYIKNFRYYTHTKKIEVFKIPL